MMNIEKRIQIRLIAHNFKRIFPNNFAVSMIALLIMLGFSSLSSNLSPEEIYTNALRILLIALGTFGFVISLLYNEWIRRDEHHLYCLHGINRLTRYGFMYLLNILIQIVIFLIGIKIREIIYG